MTRCGVASVGVLEKAVVLTQATSLGRTVAVDPAIVAGSSGWCCCSCRFAVVGARLVVAVVLESVMVYVAVNKVKSSVRMLVHSILQPDKGQ